MSGSVNISKSRCGLRNKEITFIRFKYIWEKPMNRSEISELRKLYKPEKTAISAIAGCYVDGEKNKKAVFKEALLPLPEEDVFKYLEVYKKALSGSIGKNIANIEFPIEAEDEGSTHELMMRLRDSALSDEEALTMLYDKIIDAFEYTGNYLILLCCAAYDVPGKASDGMTMDDASETVYKYIQIIICPVELAKAALRYDEESGSFSNRMRDWILSMPEFGLLFPAFNDRAADIHGMLLYTRDPKNYREEMMQKVFGCKVPDPAYQQKNSFASALETAIGDELGLEAVKELNDSLIRMKEEMAFNKAPVEVDAADFKYLLADTGISDEKRESFAGIYGEMTKESPILLDNIVSKKTMEIKTASVSIKVDAERSHLISERLIDGKKCLVVDIDGEAVEVNGVVISQTADISEG